MLQRTAAVCVLVAASSTWACRSRDDGPPARVGQVEQPAPAPQAQDAATPRIVVLGDSLTAGLGLPIDQAYPSLLQHRLDASGFHYKVVNAGVSGDTSAGGLSRLEWALDGNVRVLIVALGGNDALRALPPDELKQNLTRIIERAQARHIAVVLAGMEAPTNFGRDYIVQFHQVYPSLARQYQVAFVPFLLQNVAGLEDLNQRDGIHPTAQGARIVADNVWSVLKPLVENDQSAPAKKDAPGGNTRKGGPAGS